ncbi:hypothetical protein GCM10022233_65410 [Streptomyces shaanxiensis]|uniref:Uncharacterized protein n=1 Tax=Streptomyces shaanxiensis TaxID=653357 RepID=A0ABP7VZL3_9ACTN
MLRSSAALITHAGPVGGPAPGRKIGSAIRRMTKFIVTVCLPPTRPRKLPGAIAAAMAPYDINLTDDRNPVGRWDWWVIHSDTESPYLALPAHDGDRRLITASTVPRRKAGLDALPPLECYGGPRGLLVGRRQERASGPAAGAGGGAAGRRG